LAFAHGEGRDGATLLRMARGQGLLAGTLTGLAALAVGAASWFGIPVALPAYSDARGPILVVLVGMVVYSTGSAYGNLLSLLDRQRYHLAIQAVVLTLAVVLGIGLVTLGWGIMGPAVATASAMVAYAILLHLVVGWIGTRDVPTDRPTSMGSDVPAAP
jgi:O-antigen/teichoic acid export membrane protein